MNINVNINQAFVSILFRFLQMIPLVLVMIPLFASYWTRRNMINGLRRTRLTLILMIGSIIFENILFIIVGLAAIKDTGLIALSVPFLFFDRTLNLVAYFMLYYLFSHARKHDNPLKQV